MFSTLIAKLSSPCDLLKQMHEKKQQEKEKEKKKLVLVIVFQWHHPSCTWIKVGGGTGVSLSLWFVVL